MFKITLEDVFEKERYIHVVFWCLYIVYPLVQYAGNKYANVQWWSGNSNLPLIIIFAYVCYLYIFPKNIKLKGIILISFTLVMVGLGIIFSKYILHFKIYQLGNYSYWRHGLSILGDYAFIGLLFFSFFNVKRLFQLHDAQKKMELNSLKAQINPHFLFNTLNSIYSFSLRGDKKANDLILKLAANFKFILKEGEKEKVTVQRDLNHIKDFIAIHKIRWGDKFRFNITESIDNENSLIAPLLLISFVENAIKYTSKLEGNGHHIDLEYTLKNNVLHFKCRNPFNNSYVLSPEWEKSGIGLKNTMNRLALIYPDKNNLQIEDDNQYYNVNLTINLC